MSPLESNHHGIDHLAAFQNIHEGRHGFVIGNGPSLTAEDLDLLRDEISFAANKIYLHFPKTGFRPTYYASVDLIFLENFYDQVPGIPATKFFPLWAEKWFRPSETTFFFKEKGLPMDQGFDPRFSCDIREGIYGGYTVSFTLIQLAFYMGIRDIVLIGMDHRYRLPKKRARHPVYGEVLVSEGEMNHFHKEYRPPGEIWSIPRPHYQEQAYRLAGETLLAHGGRIINATRGGKLDIFPRLRLEDAIR